MNKVIQKKNFRFIKLCLLSPLFEVIITTVYIIAFIMMACIYSMMGSNFPNHEITEMAKEHLNEGGFKMIKTDSDYITYLETLLNTLYTYDPDISIPIMIPLGSIKMIRYTNDKTKCSDIIKAASCSSFQCTTEELGKLYQDTECASPYTGYIKDTYTNTINAKEITALKGLISNFQGDYSSYDLFEGGEQIDFTIDEYNTNKVLYQNFIKDPDLKFLALIYNLNIPCNDNYVNVIQGLEMIHYFNYPKAFFALSVYNIFDPYNAVFLTIFIIFCCAVILNVIKLLYEINIKLIFSVHLFWLFNECLNILMIIFTAMYLSSTTTMDYTSLQKEYSSHLPFMSIRKYSVVINTMIMLCIPFRIISLISWSKLISKPLVKYLGVVFRILPGVFVSVLVLGLMIFMFALMNFTLYNQTIFQFSTIYNSFLALFNLQIILEMILYNSGIYFNPINSSYYIILNLLQFLVIVLSIMFLTSSFTYLFRQASVIEEEKLEDEIMLKLDQIQEKLTQGNETIDTDLKKLKKQILWLSLSNKNDLYAKHNKGNTMLIFKTANQIISFLKYLFAIKPELQFKNLYNKFGVIIEIRNDKPTLKEIEYDEIELIIEWLMLGGCKIPVSIYSLQSLEKTLKMRLYSKYHHISFTTDSVFITSFIKEITNDTICSQVIKHNFSGFSIKFSDDAQYQKDNGVNIEQ